MSSSHYARGKVVIQDVMSNKKIHHHNNSHTPVLLERVLDVLQPKKDETYLDLTAGYGGHAKAMLAKTSNVTKFTLVDRDEQAIASLQMFKSEGARLIHQDFASASQDLYKANEQFDMILLDLGVSSPHLDNASRGFSFTGEAQLDMRMDQRQEKTAESIVNNYSEEDLIRVLKEYGEEPRAKKIARAIVLARKAEPIKTTLQLAALVEEIYSRRGKTHPATRTFQALRIEVNDELNQLRQTLQYLPSLLSLNGRLAIISFHSLEDRIVKQFLKDQVDNGYEATLKLITKKPIQGATDDVLNPRSRSAKLRGAVKIKI